MLAALCDQREASHGRAPIRTVTLRPEAAILLPAPGGPALRGQSGCIVSVGPDASFLAAVNLDMVTAWDLRLGEEDFRL